MSRARNIILCGFMGVGKSTIGQLIANRLGWRFADTDRLIEQREGRPIRDIFAQDGEIAFRAMERQLCAELPEWHHTVIATGGGLVLDPANRDALRRAGLVVCLEAPAEEIARRLAHQTDRPLLAGPNPAIKIAELLTARQEAYRDLPNHLNTTGHTPIQMSDIVLEMWRQT